MKLGKVDVKEFANQFVDKFRKTYGYSYQKGSKVEHVTILASLVKEYYGEAWIETNDRYDSQGEKQIYYFSMEFLPGRMLKNNLLNLGLLELAQEALDQLGLSLDEVAQGEVDPALGNGGLGRLASCFMDALASTALPGHGNGIRYRYGLFKQKFVDGYQVELPENWLRAGSLWEVRKESKAVTVRFGGQVHLQTGEDGRLKPVYQGETAILAVPYDNPQVGYHNGVVNNLRLWHAEIPYGDEDQFSKDREREEVRAITEVLYPDDSNYEGRVLRLKQEYFFCSAGVQSIVRKYKKLNLPWQYFSDKVGIHINDTHPALVVPELMRILLDEEGLSWEQAWETTKQTCAFTNHTVLQEAMERWPLAMVEELLPRIAQIIKEINARHIDKKLPLYGEELTYRTAIIADGQVKMANLAIIGSYSVNGVARLHTDILMHETLNDFYTMYPRKFNNKTNGITQRRWLQLSNPDLVQVLDETIGSNWKKRPTDLRGLVQYSGDPIVWQKLEAAKLANKKRLAHFFKETYDIEVSPDALFDVQVKRLHAYKRQLLNALHILDRYLQLKDNPDLDVPPRVFIFGAKAAPSYHYAKSIIKLINTLADVINQDETIQGKLKVVFVENYGVSLAELIIPAADLSEQISLAGKEASGTGNMKMMLNGALTLATLDGANIEISEYAGRDNIILFGMTADEVLALRESGSYDAYHLYTHHPRLHVILNALIDGTLPGMEAEGREIFDSLVTYQDEYFLLQDYDSYAQAQEKVDILYQNRDLWNEMVLQNIANAGPFSADYTILRYAEEIWKIAPSKEGDGLKEVMVD